jgi:hypothetical protein
MMSEEVRVDYFLMSFCLGVLCTWAFASIFIGMAGFFGGYVLAFFNEIRKENK